MQTEHDLDMAFSPTIRHISVAEGLLLFIKKYRHLAITLFVLFWIIGCVSTIISMPLPDNNTISALSDLISNRSLGTVDLVDAQFIFRRIFQAPQIGSMYLQQGMSEGHFLLKLTKQLQLIITNFRTIAVLSR